MSFGNAVHQREEMISSYKVMLETETNLVRIEDIKGQIQLCQDEIAQLKIGKPLFGKPKPLKQTITLIEADREKGGQKVTKRASAEEEKAPAKSGKKFLANALQNQIQAKKKRATFNKNKKDDDDIV